jgi:predicted SAM-dependent methyltransferase
MGGISFLLEFGAELVVSKSTELDFSGLADRFKRRPMIKHARRFVRRVGKHFHVPRGPESLTHLLAALPSRKIVVGASGRADPGWIPTEQDYLDLLKPSDWERFFQPGSVDAILAEHVWEHLTAEQGRLAAETCYRYLKPGGYLRLAVPDGFNPDPEYRSWVCVGGASPGQVDNGHKVLYTHRSLRQVLESSGFQVELYEYYDEAGMFHCVDFDVSKGKIWRSRRFDRRNQNGALGFASIVLDAVRPPESGATDPLSR